MKITKLNESIDHPYMFQYNCNNPTFGYDFQRYAQELGARRMYDHTQRGGGLHFYTVPSEDVYNKLKEVAKKRFTVDMYSLRPFDKDRYANAKVQEAMVIGYDEGSIKEQIRILEKNIEDYKQLIIEEPEDKDYWEEQIKKCEEEIADLQSYKPLDEGVDSVRIPEPYDKYFEVFDYEPDEGEYQIGETIDNYDCKVIAYLAPKPEYEDDCDFLPLLTDDPDFPVVDIVGGRIYPIDVEKMFLTEAKVFGAKGGKKLQEAGELLPIEVLNNDGTPKQYDVKFMELEKVPGLLNWDVADQLEQHFRNNKLWVDELHYNEVKDCIEYDINWGDWKHEHLRSKWLLEELFEKLGIVANINSYTTEEDGSDTYSAHYTVRATGKVNEKLEESTNKFIPEVGMEVLYKGKVTTVIDVENDPEYGFDVLIKNPNWNGEDTRFENIWVGDNITPISR